MYMEMFCVSQTPNLAFLKLFYYVRTYLANEGRK